MRLFKTIGTVLSQLIDAICYLAKHKFLFRGHDATNHFPKQNQQCKMNTFNGHTQSKTNFNISTNTVKLVECF